ncbi:MAG: hypothetical protein D6791_16585, partial [Chloroflexi bacterium]
FSPAVPEALPTHEDLRQLASQDSDQDGLSDYEETLLGTALDSADTDGDLISDLEEIQGFEWPTGSNQFWYTDPLSVDTNQDGIGDSDEWNSAERLHPTWDTDNDDTPDLFDRDNDGDGVPDKLDISPFQAFTTTFTAEQPFNLVINGLTPGKQTFVRLQLRPTNPEHLWYTLNRLDWPQDEAGNIKDVDNSPDDLQLVPMLEVTIPDAPSNLPLAEPSITVDIRPSAETPSFIQQPISGTITLTQNGDAVKIDPDLNGSAFISIREGTCAVPGKNVSNVVTVATGGSGTVALGDFASTQLKDRASGGYVITVAHQPGGPPVFLGCGQIPHTPFEGEKMIDQGQLQSYGINVREAAGKGNAGKLIYVPLSLVVDDPANLNNNTNLPAVEGSRGGRVAFSGLLPYMPQGAWGAAHQVRLVWAVRMEVDDVCLASNLVERKNDDGADVLRFDCVERANNVSQVIHTYDDKWRLTGLDVQEEHGVSTAVVFEDPAVDPDLTNDVPLLGLAGGLSDTFLAGRQVNSVRDLTVNEIARRFDHATNASVSTTERWGIANTLSVITNTYPTMDLMMRDTIKVSEGILDTNFTPQWTSQTPISPTLLYAYEWNVRELNLEVQGKDRAVLWDSSSQQLTFNFNGAASPLKTIAGLKVQPYRYDNEQWQIYQMPDFWEMLKNRHAADVAADPDPDAPGKLAFLQLLYYTLSNGVHQTVEIANIPVAYEALADTEIEGKFGQVTNARLAITWVTDALLEPVLSGTRTKQVLKFLKVSFVKEKFGDPADRVVNKILEKRINKISHKAFNRVLIGAVILSAVLVVAQLALLLTAAFGGLEGAAATGVSITLQVVSAATNVYFTVSGIISGLNAAKGAEKTVTVLGLTSKLSSLKAATALAVIGLIVQLGIIWGIFFEALATGKLDSASALHATLAFSIAATIVAVLYFAISIIPVIGPIIVAVLVFIDTILTLICEAGVDKLRGVVTEGSESCFTLAGALGEWLTSLFSASDIIFDFESDLISKASRFPQINDFALKLNDPTAGLVVSNTLTFQAKVGGKLAPSIPKGTEVKDAYTKENIRTTGIVAEFSRTKNDSLSATGSSFAAESLQFTPISFTVNGKHDFSGYITTLPSWPVSTKPITLTQAGINADYMLPVYLNIGMKLPLYSCFILFTVSCTTGEEFQDQSISQPAVSSPDFVLDILPATLEEFFARNWGTFTVDGQERGIPFSPASDFDGDGLLAQSSGGIDVNDKDPDSDNDGLPDGYEADLRSLGVSGGAPGINPLSADTDNDGLCDAYELQIGTRPDLPDTDGDGLTDAEEVWHPDCASGVWKGGWLFTYDVANNKTIRVTSDPTLLDSDGDGISDFGEKFLHQQDHTRFTFNPQVANQAPLGLYLAVSDSDAVVPAGATFVYTATVANKLSEGWYSGGVVTTTFPVGLGDKSESNSFQLFSGQQKSFATAVTASTGSRVAAIHNRVVANLSGSAQSSPGNAPPSFDFEETFPVTIDDDLPASSLTSGQYVAADGFRVIGGEATDPTSYVKQVEVRIGQSDFKPAKGTEVWAYTWAVPKAEGRYTIQTRATDAVGHVENPLN